MSLSLSKTTVLTDPALMDKSLILSKNGITFCLKGTVTLTPATLFFFIKLKKLSSSFSTISFLS